MTNESRVSATHVMALADLMATAQKYKTFATREPYVRIADENYRASRDELFQAIEQLATVAESKPRSDENPVLPYYISGPYADATYSVCETATGRVLRKFRGPADLLQAQQYDSGEARGVELKRMVVPETSERPMSDAPLDGILVQLLVRFDNQVIEDTSDPTWTIGWYNDGEWNFVGWNWHRDEWTRGSGDLLGWLPMGVAKEHA